MASACACTYMHVRRCHVVAMCTADPCRLLPNTCPSPMPPNTTCHANFCAHAVSTRSGRPVAVCGAVWVDEEEDREVCGTFKDEHYTLTGYDELHAKYMAMYERLYARQAVGGGNWLWVGAACGLVLLLVVGLAAVHRYLRVGHNRTQRKNLALSV